jgi:hypothetical protein
MTTITHIALVKAERQFGPFSRWASPTCPAAGREAEYDRLCARIAEFYGIGYRNGRLSKADAAEIKRRIAMVVGWEIKRGVERTLGW